MRALLGLVVVFILLAACVEAADARTFVDVTTQAGVMYDQMLGTPSVEDEEAFMSGGAAACDYNRDGLVDLFVTRLDAPDILFRNKGDGTFEDVSAQAGFTQTFSSNAAVWFDADKDGDSDLYVATLYENRNLLYINDGQGRFTEEAVGRGADLSTAYSFAGFAAAVGDYDGDGWPDLFTGDWGFNGHGQSCCATKERLRRDISKT